MRFAAILVLAAGLSMDAAAVATVRGATTKHLRALHFLSVALYFGGSQALMPLLGYWLGSAIGDRFEAWDHWIAFVLLGGIGAKMLYETATAKDDDDDVPADAFAPRLMLPLAIATSVDAFAVGATLPMLGAPLALSVITIGVVTAVCSMVGLGAGHRFGRALGKRFEAIGGVVLILLGVKILIEHLGAS
ncbi:MAG: manganese efflux pump [Myxococcales bacterium]|nr:manganese efflux pump [Myxococcales bacterium]